MQELAGRALALVGYVCAWCRENPGLAWALVTATITVLFKPRTREEYAALAQNWPRLAAFLQLVAALGIDPVKTMEAARKLPKGKSLPPPPMPKDGES